MNWPIPLNTKGTPINEILTNHPYAHILKQQLNKHSIYYIEQFLSYNNTELLNWQDFHHNILKIPRGQIPKWFKEIQELIRSTANPTTSLTYPNLFTLTKWILKKKFWVLTHDFAIGRTNHFNNYSATIHHYTRLTDNTLLPCSGCIRKDPILKTKKCYFTHKIEKLFTIQVDSLKKLHANFNNLLLTKSIISKAGKKTIPCHTKLSRPLNAFSLFNINWWNTLSANNSSTRASSIFISSSSHSPHCNNKLLATALLNNNTTT